MPLPRNDDLVEDMTEKQSESVGFGRAIRNFYKYYGIFTGRSSRSEYWYLWLYSLLLYFALVTPLTLVPSLEAQVAAVTALPLLILLAHLVPSLALSVRRLRDAGFSPYLAFLYLAPFGGLVLAILALFETKPISATGANGSNPTSSHLESEIKNLEDLHRQGLIDDNQLKEAKNKTLGI